MVAFVDWVVIWWGVLLFHTELSAEARQNSFFFSFIKVHTRAHERQTIFQIPSIWFLEVV